jgi:hypothetical protein
MMIMQFVNVKYTIVWCYIILMITLPLSVGYVKKQFPTVRTVF